jgi:hypothetical protein
MRNLKCDPVCTLCPCILDEHGQYLFCTFDISSVVQSPQQGGAEEKKPSFTELIEFYRSTSG